MAHINLLPWRDELRKQRQQEFVTALIGALLVAGAVFFYVHSYVGGIVDGQKERNDYLQSETQLLDKQIAEILDLEKTKDRLIQKMDIIQQLQRSRSQIVHLFDEIVRTLPDGVYLSSVRHDGNELTIRGVAQSNARVSAYMRNIENSAWLTAPRLQIIETASDKGKGNTTTRVSRFTLVAKQVTQNDTGEGEVQK